MVLVLEPSAELAILCSVRSTYKPRSAAELVETTGVPEGREALPGSSDSGDVLFLAGALQGTSALKIFFESTVATNGSCKHLTSDSDRYLDFARDRSSVKAFRLKWRQHGWVRHACSSRTCSTFVFGRLSCEHKYYYKYILHAFSLSHCLFFFAVS
jgi:hypothetical protein